jgi:DNA-3-methyladenine glycosylase
MYGQGGTAYIYLCYGIHHLFNVVTATKDIPHAILIRAIAPLQGIDIMLERRKMQTVQPGITAGPGALSVALGLDLKLNGLDLVNKGGPVWIEDRDIQIVKRNITASPRVGVGYAGADASLPWRFRIKDNKWTSPAK